MNTQSNATPESIAQACSSKLVRLKGPLKFTFKNGMVHLKKFQGDKTVLMPVCDPFEVVARTYDPEGQGAGLVVRFSADRIGKPVIELTVKRSDLLSRPKHVVAMLSDHGLWVSGSKDGAQVLAELLSMFRPNEDVITAGRAGWYGKTFVSPTYEVLGDQADQYRLLEGAGYEDPGKAGDLEGWKHATTAALTCENGDFLCIGLLSGFTGILVDLLDEQTSPILNFAGTTSRGKTTAQRLGASVFGNPMRGAALKQFNVTINAIEAIAERATGSLLAIDEGAQSGMDGKAYQKAIFDLAGSSGKRRLTAAATERKARRWSTCITISEEIGFADKVKCDGRNAAAGAVARCWEISVEDAAILDGETLAKIEGIKQNYGHAAPIFIQHLIDDGYAADPDLIRARVSAAQTNLSQKTDAPQVRRVAGAAALVLVAGELAQEAGLIVEDYEVSGAVGRILQRSKILMAQDMDPLDTALSNLRESVIRRNGVDVVELHYEADHQNREVVAFYGYPDGESFTSVDRDRSHYERVYFIPADQMFKLGGGNVTASAMAKALKKEGFLVDAPGNNNQWSSVPEIGQIKNYRVSGAFFHESEKGG
ncbi:hypothetical protein AN191_15300 [Loktanella sp. 5RATIMAR09]|uniref:DUF927 domain-containing protein n=1 Tax=Loktanella sp. 5RATIMAR09 TaxID=1225655 RepID=UPI0006EBBC81|nr:DUF927 domain-containing protein [Loktanella sp. 5RATIMAR09]KQI71063.1 hypothetical protein AN191_15300 [Loktanella sp. 5RATIMAR09]